MSSILLLRMAGTMDSDKEIGQVETKRVMEMA